MEREKPPSAYQSSTWSPWKKPRVSKGGLVKYHKTQSKWRTCNKSTSKEHFSLKPNKFAFFPSLLSHLFWHFVKLGVSKYPCFVVIIFKFVIILCCAFYSLKFSPLYAVLYSQNFLPVYTSCTPAMILLAEEEATTIVEVGKELIFFTLIVVIDNFHCYIY